MLIIHEVCNFMVEVIAVINCLGLGHKSQTCAKGGHDVLTAKSAKDAKARGIVETGGCHTLYS